MAADAKGGDGKGKRRPINLALQGGGAHGAFTWGVLDRLLEDGRFSIEGISGTSAGAMNAVCLADGFADGGPEAGVGKARTKLRDFWRAIGRNWRFSAVQRTAWDRFMGNWSLDASPWFLAWDVFSRFFSPYQANPLNINPVLDALRKEIDFDRVQACESIRLFLSATNVRNGKVRIFETHEITAEAVMASACLPHLFQAVEIDGLHYWDGGYMGNPALFPLFHTTQTEDILLVQINPIERESVPRTAREIVSRLDEITFNASLLREFRAIEFVSRLIEEGKLDGRRYKKIRMHRIHGDQPLKELSASSRLNSEWEFLKYLRNLGRAAAADWLEMDAGKVGVAPGIDLEEEIAYRLVEERPRPTLTPRVRATLGRMRDGMGGKRS